MMKDLLNPLCIRICYRSLLNDHLYSLQCIIPLMKDQCMRPSFGQDVAEHALECILKKLKDEGCPLIREDTVFCKSILNEFVVKMNLEMPTYNTTQSGGVLPLFVSTLVFNGATYRGETGRNKKEAEQLAARAVIQSLLGIFLFLFKKFKHIYVNARV